MWTAITDQSELEMLSEPELLARVRPLLRRGNLATNDEQLKRVRPNIPSACAELAAEWSRSPRLNGRTVAFNEYLAARLCTLLHELDQQHYPELYDPHRQFHPERQPLSLLEQAADNDDTAPNASPLPPAAAAQSIPDPKAREQRLQTAMNNAQIAGASQAALRETISKFEQGKIRTPYRLSRDFGLSPTEARYQPATGAYLELRDYQAD